MLVIPTRKEAISIRLDEDVLAFFKGLGAGYQTRINAVLRHFTGARPRAGRNSTGPDRQTKEPAAVVLSIPSASGLSWARLVP